MGQNKETLCWNCARATGNPQFRCPWVQNFTPVKGWEVTLIALNNTSQKGGEIVRTFCVLGCPLYIKLHEFETTKDVMDCVMKELNIARVQFYRNSQKYFKEYEKQTGKILPGWCKECGIKKINQALKED